MKKTDQSKQLFLEQLKKTPIILVVCEKLSVSRATFYRWKAEDSAFAKQADDALNEGRSLVNDLAESQLVGAIKDRDIRAIMYWLRHNHPTYANRLEIEGVVNTVTELTPEQKALVKKALELTGFCPPQTYETPKDGTK